MFLWNLTILATRLLPSVREREALLGDIEERELHGSFRGFREVMALVCSRQLRLWMSWRPWVAWIALFPALAMLLGSAISIAHLASKFPWQDLGEFTPQRLWIVTICAAVCIVVWSWCIGFGIGWVAREAWIGVTVALSASAVMLIETTVNASIPARLLLALFAAVLVTAPAYAGLRRGLHKQPLDAMQALTVTVTPIAALLVSVSQQPGSGWPIDIRELLLTLLFLWPVLIPSASRFAIHFRSR